MKKSFSFFYYSFVHFYSSYHLSRTEILELNWIAWVLNRDWKIIPLAAI